ncbi:hypothetical protein C8A01DRAFT_48650 [Parachaetomium inaequale]|uniref:Rhodopsin domain-containing protein n=1 Tax=Parachaetomium inaequale TaxID=2588326 RepID=A0AAN6PB23_9PEZI|nr:hypothetical protein C8A01DRAFT_48650 [Parachaetomium inaequale]
MRFYSRTLTARPYFADDWLVVASLLSQFVMAGSIIAGVQLADVGYHVEYVQETNPAAITRFFQFLVFWSAWYLVTFPFPKLAICLMYRRLFPQRSVQIIMAVTAAILIGTAIGAFFADIFACRPFDTHWAHLEVQHAHCFDKEPLFVWSNFPNIVTDVVMLILPLPIVWKLHTPFRLKVALTGTFLVGSMGLVASILRFQSFANNNSFIDLTHTAVELLVWTLLEPGIYLISACLLMSRPLLDKFARKIGSGGHTQAGAYGSSGSRKLGRSVGRSVEDGDVNGSTIALGSKSAPGGGFRQLPDDGYDYPYPSSNIVVTTHIDQSWADGASIPMSNLATPGRQAGC